MFVYNTYMSRKLKEPCSILLFDSEENEVEFINYPTGLGYSFYGVSFNDCLSVGSLQNEKYATLEEYLKARKEIRDKCIKDCASLLLSDGYYEMTQGLAILYQQYAKEYYDEKKKYEGHYKKFMKEEIYHLFNDFFLYHPGLNEEEKFYLDSRFRLMSYDEKYIDNAGHERTIGNVKENRIFSKDEFIASVIENTKDYIEREDGYDKEWIDFDTNDFNDLKETAKEILKNHSRVGLIGDNTKGHVLEIKGLSLDDFTLYDYLRVKDKYIYWFDK